MSETKKKVKEFKRWQYVRLMKKEAQGIPAKKGAVLKIHACSFLNNEYGYRIEIKTGEIYPMALKDTCWGIDERYIESVSKRRAEKEIKEAVKQRKEAKK